MLRASKVLRRWEKLVTLALRQSTVDTMLIPSFPPSLETLLLSITVRIITVTRSPTIPLVPEGDNGSIADVDASHHSLHGVYLVPRRQSRTRFRCVRIVFDCDRSV